jgi:purine-binding chemotaxis protein CheW
VCLSGLVEGAPQPDDTPRRVLLVRGQFSSFGLVVTSTDSIESFTHPASEHPEGWETGMGDGGSNGRVRSLVSIGKGEQNHWMTLINLRNVVEMLEHTGRPPKGRHPVERLDAPRTSPGS